MAIRSVVLGILGVAAAGSGVRGVLTAGIAGLFAGAASMAAGEYKLSLEQGLLVLNELARGEQIELAGCRSCSGVIVSDRLSHGRLECAFCTRSGQNQEGTLGSRDPAENDRATVRRLPRPRTAMHEPPNQH